LREVTWPLFITEPIQGHGVIPAARGVSARAKALCEKHGRCWSSTEIQTGLGRTGRFFAFEHERRDATCVLAKALSGGFVPVGAVLLRPETYAPRLPEVERWAWVNSGNVRRERPRQWPPGSATLHALDEERIVERASRLVSGCATARAAHRNRSSSRRSAAETDGRRRIRKPGSRMPKLGWKTVSWLRRGLFAQWFAIPLFERHRILSQAAGPAIEVLKFIPPLVVTTSRSTM